MRHAARVDDNQNAIVDALRAAGCAVCCTQGVGHGFPDLLVCRVGRVYLLELKRGRGKLTSDQETFHHQGWPVAVVRNVTEALEAVGLRVVAQVV